LSQLDGALKNIRVDNTVTEAYVAVANMAEMFEHPVGLGRNYLVTEIWSSLPVRCYLVMAAV
jgi:hypothetical protein